jgi:hypothetical protein
MKRSEFYLLDVIRDRAEAPDLRRRIESTHLSASL